MPTLDRMSIRDILYAMNIKDTTEVGAEFILQDIDFIVAVAFLLGWFDILPSFRRKPESSSR